MCSLGPLHYLSFVFMLQRYAYLQCVCMGVCVCVSICVNLCKCQCENFSVGGLPGCHGD